MKRALSLFLICVIGWMISACSLAHPFRASSELPLTKGTSWVYSYIEYEPDSSNPEKIITATYQFTDNIVENQSHPPYQIAHVQHTESLVKADPGWIFTPSSRPQEYWYIADGQKVYQSNQPLDMTNLHLDDLLLVWDFPLSPGKSWCPLKSLKGVQIQDCSASGQKTVTTKESYQTPAGDFKDCYQVMEASNSGGIIREFCSGVGVVAAKYDHAGTRFGFQETLTRFTRGKS